jgi:RimK family alpha-L-glutamate ligase
MDFYCIVEETNTSVREFIISACKKKSLNYIEIDPGTSKVDILNYPKPKKGDLLYRVSANNSNAKKIEYELFQEGVKTFYSDPDIIFRPSSGLKLKKAGISIPKTIPVLTSNRPILEKYAEHLGGFPIIIKAMGGKEGVGIMKVDSLGSLFSIADYLYKSSGSFFLREFIDIRESVRTIVIGGKVVSSMIYKVSNSGDFRTNRRTGYDGMEECSCPTEIEKLSIDAVSAMGLEFGGVDILVDKAGKGYVLEVNFPCNFSDVQIINKIDVASLMLEYLINK